MKSTFDGINSRLYTTESQIHKIEVLDATQNEVEKND